jgi:two-component system sensor histidine kinase BarA
VNEALTSSAPATEDRPAIDPATFAALVEMTGGEMDFVDELVDTFLEDGAAQVAALEAAIAAGGAPESLVRPAHSLKSSSLNVGALGLGELSRQLEEAARTGAVADAADRVAAIAMAFDDVRRELLDDRARRTSD